MMTRKLELSLLSFAWLGGLSVAYATPPSNSAYKTDLQTSHVEDATSRGIDQVNMITCIMSALRPEALVNQPSYLALVDQGKCDPGSRSSTSNAGSSDGTQAPSYLTATVNSSRTSNSDPMIVKAWIDDSSEDGEQEIFVRISATQAPTVTNPYGEFRLDFCGRAEGIPTCLMNGYLEGTSTGLNYFETEMEDSGERTVALRLNASGTTTGSGHMRFLEESSQADFNFAYNGSLFRRVDDGGDQCFSRDASDPDTGLSVWRYGLYDSQTGARIERNSGFPIEFVSNAVTYHGYLGYFGLSLPPEAADALVNGSTVQKVDYSAGDTPTKTSYTVAKADGKLLKFTKKTRTLHSMDQIKFMTFVGFDGGSLFAGAQPNTSYEMFWDEANSQFTVTAQMSCGPNGCTSQDLPQQQAASVPYFASQGGIRGSSQVLGGEVFIDLHDVNGTLDSNAIEVVYRTQDLVYPSDLPATLYCLNNCPTAASMASYFAPGSSDESPYAAGTFNKWMPTLAPDVTQYTSDTSTALLKDSNSEAVTFTDRETLQQRPQYAYGVRTGRLFEQLSDAECESGSGTYCDWRVNNLTTYYQWETGPGSFNQFAAVKDGSGSFVQFDAPLQVTFNVPTAASFGQYAGTSILLQYGGFGDLWGIPGYCVSRDSNEPLGCESADARYVPLFVVPFDETTGVVSADQKTYLVKWLDREIRFAKKSTATCDAASLTASGNVTLPSSADLRNPSDSASSAYIGAKPVVTDATRVIHGDVKF
jgi:hypothetical protein